MQKKHPGLFEKVPLAAPLAAAPAQSVFAGIVAGRVRAELAAKQQVKPQRRFAEEQRRSTRAPVDIPATFEVGARGSRAGRVRDLSRGGVQLIADEAIPQGTSVKVTFDQSHLLTSRPSSSITVDGKVVRTSSLRSPAGHFSHGIAFAVGAANSERIRGIVLEVSLAIGSSVAAAGGDNVAVPRSTYENR